MNTSDHEEERGRIPSGTPAHALPGNLSRYIYEAKKSPPLIPVPPGWRRLLLPERVVYFSPSGIRLKSIGDVKDYLTTEGTCKCGLSCGFFPDKLFDFDIKKQSEVSRVDPGGGHSSCQFAEDVANISATACHLHCPKKSEDKKTKKKKKKKRPLFPSNGGTLDEVHEAENQRINEIISETKKEYEDQLKLHSTPVDYGKPKCDQQDKCTMYTIPTSPQGYQRQSFGGLTAQQLNPPLPPSTNTLFHHGQAGYQMSSSPNLAKPPSLQILAQPPQQSPVQPVMQLVNTINGPVLMPTMSLQQHTHSGSNALKPQTLFASPLSKKVSKKDKKNKVPLVASVPTSQVLTSSNGQILLGTSGTHFQGSPGILSPQNILMHQNHPSLIQNPVILHNGVLMQAPLQPQQILLNHHQFPEGHSSLIQYPPPPQGSSISTPQQSQVLAAPPSGHLPQTYIMTHNGQLVPSSSPANVLPNMDILNNNNQPPQPNTVRSSSSPFSSRAPKASTPSPPPLSPPKLTKEVLSEDIIEFETPDELEEVQRKHEKSLMIHSFQKKIKRHSGSKKNHSSSPPSKGSFIQSNLVDSSGLRATPPHSSSNDSTFDALVASVKNHPSYKNKKPVSSNRILFVDSDESELEEEESTRRLLSKKKTLDKKKRKKRNADDMVIQRNNTITHSDGEDEYSLDDSGTSGNSSHHAADDFKVGDLVWGPFGAFPSWPGKLIRGADEEQKVLICWFGSKTITKEDPTALKTLSEGFDAHHKERKKMRKSRKLNASLEKAIQEAMMELDNDESMRCS